MASASLLLDGREIGRAAWSIIEGKAELRASCPFEQGYIYRVSLQRGEQSVYLGVMEPEGGRFILRRSLPASALKMLEGAGGEPVAVICRTLPGHRAEPTAAGKPSVMQDRKPDRPSILPQEKNLDFIADERLRAIVSCKSNILYSAENGMHSVAFPIVVGESSDFAAFFSAASCRKDKNGFVGVLKIDASGHICS